MFLRAQDIRNQPNFQSKLVKNRACNPNMLFGTSNHTKYEKVTQQWSPKGIQNSWKININPPWDIQEPSWVRSPKTPKINKFECSQSAASRGPAAGAKPLNPPHLVRGGRACWTRATILCIRTESEASPSLRRPQPCGRPVTTYHQRRRAKLQVRLRWSKVRSRWLHFGSL